MNHCIDCKQFYCDECLDSSHKVNKKFSKHQIQKYDQSFDSKTVLQCVCPLKQSLEVFCLKCQSAFCQDCIFFLHKDHQTIPLSEVIEKNKQTNTSENKEFMKEILESFTKVHNSFITSIEERIGIHNKEFNELFDQVINLLKKYKEIYFDQVSKEVQTLKHQLLLIQNSLLVIIDENDKRENLQPNKLFQINKFFEQSSKKIFVNDFRIEIVQNQFLKNLKKTLSLSELKKKKFIEFLGEGEFSIGYSLNESAFTSNPLELIKREPIVLEQKSFCSNCWKSNLLVSFILNEKTFLVWPGDEHDKKYYYLHVYNISLMKKEKVIQKSTSPINILSMYPNETDLDAKIWLYTGENSGILRVYGLEIDNFFTEIYKIDAGKPIISAVIFKDKFEELNDSEPNDTIKIYALVSFHDANLPLRMYKLNGINGGELIREIENPVKQLCYTINFFYDEIYGRSCFFFGFSKSYVKIYDLKSNLKNEVLK